MHFCLGGEYYGAAVALAWCKTVNSHFKSKQVQVCISDILLGFICLASRHRLSSQSLRTLKQGNIYFLLSILMRDKKGHEGGGRIARE